MDIKNLYAKLTDYGCDIEGATERFDNDDELYASCIEIFIEDENFEKLVKDMEKKDYKAAFDSAHSLKGVSANLGLTPVFNVISEVVEDLRAGRNDSAEAIYDNVGTEREKLINIVNSCQKKN